VGGLLTTQNTPIAESHSWALVCHLLKFTPMNFFGFIASENQPSLNAYQVFGLLKIIAI
jgi:hypothetical protein